MDRPQTSTISAMVQGRGIPHYFPACVIGGFGEPDPTKPGRRYARVSVRMATTNKILNGQRAEKIAAAWNEYTIQAPPPRVSPTFIDGLWDTYEPDLSEAIDALERGAFGRAEWACVLGHVHAQAVRNPNFLVKATTYLASLGVENPTRDDLQYERIRTLVNTPKIMAESRFALLRRPVDSRALIVNDKGYTSLHDSQFDTANVIFSLSPQIAVLMVVGVARSGDDHMAGPMRELTLTRATVDVINEASWKLGGITCIIGHPQDEPYLASLDANKPLTPTVLGPYRGTADVSLSDWAVMDRPATRLTVQHRNGSWHGVEAA